MTEMKSKGNLNKLASAIVRFVSGLVRSVYQPSKYAIKRGYIHHAVVVQHDDRGLKDTFQKEVYEYAATLMAKHQWHTIVDMGCGSGYKSAHYLGEFVPAHHAADLIICADVIEHVEDPDQFMKHMLAIRDWKCLMISTPERNKRRGSWHYGPPPNPAHYREWSMEELKRFVAGYAPVYSTELINPLQGTQLILCMRE